MMQQVIAGGITQENVGALEKMMGLYERSQAKHAEQEFARSFADLQKDLPKIHATREVPNRDGTVRYKFAPFEEIMREAQPYLSKHGFSVSFNTKWDSSRLIVSCKLLHAGGHSQTNEFAARVGGGPPGANEAQADMAVKTLAKRGALCDALNIVVEHDTDGDDARIEGDVITKEQSDAIRQLIRETKTDTEKFLALAQADSIDKIRTARLDELMGVLERRKKRAESPKATDPDHSW